jgi:hypothetical protein
MIADNSAISLAGNAKSNIVNLNKWTKSGLATLFLAFALNQKSN